MILLQKGKTLARRDDDFAACRFKLSGQNLEERRFSGAVCTDQTIAAALCEFDLDIFKESFFSVSSSDVACTDHIYVLLTFLVNHLLLLHQFVSY